MEEKENRLRKGRRSGEKEGRMRTRGSEEMGVEIKASERSGRRLDLGSRSAIGWRERIVTSDAEARDGIIAKGKQGRGRGTEKEGKGC
jgi:hypothetical protein